MNPEETCWYCGRDANQAPWLSKIGDSWVCKPCYDEEIKRLIEEGMIRVTGINENGEALIAISMESVRAYDENMKRKHDAGAS